MCAIANPIGLIAVVLCCLFSACSQNRTEDNSDRADSSQNGSTKSDCSTLEPQNPYDEGTGHYAGYEWGEEGHTCSGNSTSFIEGCHEHEEQVDKYEACGRS
jgi:hypothetical protein